MNEGNIFDHFGITANSNQQIVLPGQHDLHQYSMAFVHQNSSPTTFEFTQQMAQELHNSSLSSFNMSPHFNPLLQVAHIHDNSIINTSNQQNMFVPNIAPVTIPFELPTETKPETKSKKKRAPRKKPANSTTKKSNDKTIPIIKSKLVKETSISIPAEYKNLRPFPMEIKPRTIRTSIPEMNKVDKELFLEKVGIANEVGEKSSKKALKVKRAAEREELRKQLKAIQENRYRPVFYYQPPPQVVVADATDNVVDATSFNGRFRKIMPKDPRYI